MEAIASTIKTPAVTPTVAPTVAPTVSLGSVQTTHVKTEQPTPQKDAVVTEKQVQQAINDIVSNIGTANESIGFSYEKKLGQLFVVVTDNKSGEVIREVPSKDFIKHTLAMQEMIGLLLDKQV